MMFDEIWLWLMKVSSLYGDRMVEIVQCLCVVVSVDCEVLYVVGMIVVQVKLFFWFDEYEFDEMWCWLG